MALLNPFECFCMCATAVDVYDQSDTDEELADFVVLKNLKYL